MLFSCSTGKWPSALALSALALPASAHSTCPPTANCTTSPWHVLVRCKSQPKNTLYGNYALDCGWRLRPIQPSQAKKARKEQLWPFDATSQHASTSHNPLDPVDNSAHRLELLSLVNILGFSPSPSPASIFVPPSHHLPPFPGPLLQLRCIANQADTGRLSKHKTAAVTMSDLYLSRLRNWALSSPPVEWALHQVRELAIGAIKQGPVPKHVAFVMDGNRRFARNHKIETLEGHHLGFEALARVLEICYKSGAKVITVYAFSIENFNRPKYEVDGLMELAKVKMEQIMQHGEILDRYGAAVRVLGQRDLIRADVLEVFDRAEETTKNNGSCVLNICFPYTSREEITRSIRTTVEQFSSPHTPPPPPPQNTTFSETRIKQKILSKKLDSPEALSTIRETSPSPSMSRYDDHDDSVSTDRKSVV